MDSIRNEAHDFLVQLSKEVPAFEKKAQSPNGWLRASVISHLHCTFGYDRERASDVLDHWLAFAGRGTFKVEFLLAICDGTWTTRIIDVPYSEVPDVDMQSHDAILDWLHTPGVGSPVGNSEFEDVVMWAIYHLNPEVDEPEDLGCPGCGCQPGDGRTPGCNHPDGCGWENKDGGKHTA